MMDLIFLQKFLNVYSWVAASIIMVLFIAIAHFYERKFGVRTFYYFYLIPVFVLLIPACLLFPPFTFMAEIIELVGALGSLIASYLIYRKMVGVK